MDKILFTLLVVFTLHSKVTLGNVAPNFIHVCPGLTSECLKKNIQETIPYFVKGVPELGIEPLDPMHQNSTKLTLPGGLMMQFIDGNVYGMRKCILDHVQYDIDKKSAELSLRCNITIKGRYKANGRILIITIDGDGDAKIKATNVLLKCKLKFEDKERDGIVYHEIKHVSVHHTFNDKVTFDLSNLFKGNPTISETVLNFLNENWRQVATEFGGPIVDGLVNAVIANIKKFFHFIPKNELIILD